MMPSSPNSPLTATGEPCIVEEPHRLSFSGVSFGLLFEGGPVRVSFLAMWYNPNVL
jgi:hypothetical protein